MARYVLLEGNVVTNMIEAEASYTPASGLTKILMSHGGKIGDIYDPSDGSFTTPDPEEEE